MTHPLKSLQRCVQRSMLREAMQQAMVGVTR